MRALGDARRKTAVEKEETVTPTTTPEAQQSNSQEASTESFDESVVIN
jgi:hypothetical protein